jgi:hypothetical protein
MMVLLIAAAPVGVKKSDAVNALWRILFFKRRVSRQDNESTDAFPMTRDVVPPNDDVQPLDRWMRVGRKAF